MIENVGEAVGIVSLFCSISEIIFGVNFRGVQSNHVFPWPQHSYTRVMSSYQVYSRG